MLPKLLNPLMKTHIIIICLFVFNIPTGAQFEVQSSSNFTHSGRNIAFTVSKSFNKNEIGVGLRYNIGTLAHPDDQNNVYKNRLYPTEPIHYFGLVGFYHRSVLTNWTSVKPFVFYDVQASYSTTRNRMMIPTGLVVQGDNVYRERIEFFGPFTWIEQCLGIGFKADLFGSFYISQKIGFGISFILGKDDKLWEKYYDWFTWEFAGLFNVGIGYRFD